MSQDYAGLLQQVTLEGTFQGREAALYHVMGKRTSFVNTTAYHDIGEILTSATSFTELAGTESFEVVSSSANDAAAGTGSRTVQIGYIDSTSAIATTTVTLNGVTPVAVGVLGAQMILWMESLTVGSGGVAAGNILLRITSAGATHEQITAGGNRSLSGRWMVPLGYEALIPNWAVSAINLIADSRLRATVNTYGRTVCTGVYKFQDSMYVPSDNSIESDAHWVKLPALCKVKISVIPSTIAGNTRSDCSFPIILIKG